MPAKPRKRPDNRQGRPTDQSAGASSGIRIPRQNKKCFFCENQKEPDFTDANQLRRFISDRSKIVSKQRTGACSKHQRRVTKQVKYARHLALLPFVTRV